jgi:hypothetical protein
VEASRQEGEMKKLLAIAALGEGATGLVLLVYPPIATRLLLNETVAGAGSIVGRVAGIALIALGAACWPGADMRRGSFAMLTYSTIVMLLLGAAGVRGTAGILLWPAVAVHAALSLLLVWAAWKQQIAEVGTQAQR